MSDRDRRDGPHPRTPVYGGAWFGGSVEIYRRGVTSDASPFSRPLPLYGIDQRAVRATRLDAPTLVAPPWCGGRRVVQPCGAREGELAQRAKRGRPGPRPRRAARGRYNVAQPVIPRPRRGRGNPLFF